MGTRTEAGPRARTTAGRKSRKSRADGPPSNAARLERLWGGEFGRAYTERNAAAVAAGRERFWRTVAKLTRPRSVLEVGCNVGANLPVFAGVGAAVGEPIEVWGLDVNDTALERLRAALPRVNAVRGVARELPFRDGWFDLAFTCGVLIHQPPEALPLVMAEVVRVARRHVLAAEYFAEDQTEVPYRGQSGALFKRDFGGLYASLFPGLALVRTGFLGRADGFDDVTYWLFEKRR